MCFLEVKEIRARLPFNLFGIDIDGGSEFINDEMYRYCRGQGIAFTRGRLKQEERRTPYRAEELVDRPPDGWLRSF
ncbi:MAG: hypothetical protein LBU61_04520 [Coriobacteriales bacterium]|jgi:hypothetical protein|nr:hypothetical protein [Coriobacteriales bacterium]